MPLTTFLRRWQPLLVAVLLGSIGGWIASQFRIPLAWMIGSVITTTIAALSGVRIGVPRDLRMGMSVILGILLGSTFHPEIFEGVARWLASLAGAGVYAFVAMSLGVLTLRLAGRYDPVTAFFAASPGSFAAMTIMGQAYGGDERVIALNHSVRVVVVVTTVPLLFQALGLYDADLVDRISRPASALSLTDILLLASCTLGIYPARWLRIRAEYLVGPLAVSAIIHLAGLTEAKPPDFIVSAAQVVIGAFVGARFVGIDVRRIWKILVVAVVLAVQMIAVSVAIAFTLHELTGLPLAVLLLSMMPGGLSEMSLVAIAMQIEPAIVALHHLTRLMLIIICAPFVYRLYARLAPASPRSPPGE